MGEKGREKERERERERKRENYIIDPAERIWWKKNNEGRATR